MKKLKVIKTCKVRHFLMLMFIFTSVVVYGQIKPEIQVSFTIDPSSTLNDFIDGDVSVLEKEAEDIITAGLNKAIGFLGFSNASSSNTLAVTLNDIEGAHSSEYWLHILLTFETNSYEHNWMFTNENETQGIDEDNLINELETKWNEYMNKGIDRELMPKLFRWIAFNLPDDTHYNLTDNPKSVTLPFSPNDLRINCDGSEFRVVTTIISNEDIELPIEHKSMGAAADDKILIPLTALEATSVKFGKIFIVIYKRDNTATISGGNNFLGDQ